jgi:hypothetical protein
MKECISFIGPGLCRIFKKMRECAECGYYCAKEEEDPLENPLEEHKYEELDEELDEEEGSVEPPKRKRGCQKGDKTPDFIRKAKLETLEIRKLKYLKGELE